MPPRVFDVVSYNQTDLIREANERFEKQLASVHISRAEFFAKLAPLFVEEVNAGRYAACLIHRHYLLTDGERMVTTGDSTKPSKDISPNIVPESWLATGEAFEYRYIDNPASLPPPPSADFLAKFKSITDAYSIDTIGICYTPPVEELAPGFVFLEVAGTLDREQVTKAAPVSSLTASSYEAIWITKINSNGQFEMAAKTCCNHGPDVSSPPA